MVFLCMNNVSAENNENNAFYEQCICRDIYANVVLLCVIAEIHGERKNDNKNHPFY